MRAFLPVLLFSAAAAFAQTSLPSLSTPALSPDGREVAFVSGGDIWTVPSGGGEAHLLVANPATESRPLYSPDGQRLAFLSTRTGAGNIYILTLATGQLDRLTYSDVPEMLDAWSADGQWIYFTSSVNDVNGQGDIFRVRSTGGTPLEVSREHYLNEFESAPSPDGSQIALVARGISNSQWWRNGHSHIDETEVWLKPVAEPAGYHRLLAADCKHAWPMWSADGRTLFYMTDGSGAENLWAASTTGDATPRALTHFTSGRVLWPSIGNGGRTIVFERDFAIWRADTKSGKAEKVEIQLRGAPSSPAVSHLTENTFNALALSPDGKKLALVAHGALFAASAKEGGDALRLQSPAVFVSDPSWSPDSSRVVYAAEQADGSQQIELFDLKPASAESVIETGTAHTLTAVPGRAEVPVLSPDGKSIAYVLNQRELHVLTLGTDLSAKPEDRTLATGQLEDPVLAWSPDSQWIAFTQVDDHSFRNLHVVARAGGEPRPITFLANGETASRIAWSPDGTFILFDTSQRSERVQMARIDLLPHVPRFREDEFRELFRPSKQPGTPSTTPPAPDRDSPTQPVESTPEPRPTTAAKLDAKPDAKPSKTEPTRIVFEGIRQRLTILPLGLSAETPVISPDGKVLLFTAESAGQQQLYTYSLDELSREPAVARQLTSTPGRKDHYTFSPDSKEVLFLENDSPRSIALEARTPKPIAVTARLTVDFDQEKHVVFQQAWGNLDRRFFLADFNHHDWTALRTRWQPYIAGARTPDELRRDINLLIGELNASHSGIGAPRSGPRPLRVGYLGLTFQRASYESGHGLVIRDITTLGPADIANTAHPHAISAGDTLTAIDGQPIAAANLDHLLEDSVDRRVVLTLVSPGGQPRQVAVRPVAHSTLAALIYREWVQSRRDYVERISHGKVGYVHMPDMGDDSLQQLYLDLDAQNQSRQAVIIDIRNNNGGYVNGYALDVFTRRNYLLMTPRGMATFPGRQALGQRALGLPTALVTNESSLSDAEDFTEGYRTLHLGKVVGQPTAGWIIFTGGTRLIDGSTLRLPGDRIRDTRGQDMEMHPRRVDIAVERPLGETESGEDAQLARAVQELLATP